MDGIRFQNPMGSIQSSATKIGGGGIQDIASQSKDGSLGIKGSTVDGGVGASFADTLKSAIGKVNDLQKSADVQMEKLATGQSQNLHETMIASEKAEISLKLMVQVRNKIIDAYHEIMKMQV
jgi:flagellar hook-basal body complex protein FliE